MCFRKNYLLIAGLASLGLCLSACSDEDSESGHPENDRNVVAATNRRQVTLNSPATVLVNERVVKVHALGYRKHINVVLARLSAQVGFVINGVLATN
jgi:hypothetical protein